MIDCSIIKRIGGNVALIQECDQIASGAVRMLTNFLYPNGSHIDLFLEEPEPLLGTVILSDLGQTTGYLLDAQVKPWATNKRRQVVEDICRALDVSWRGGRLQVELDSEDLDNLPPVMMRLGQACIRMSDLASSARMWSEGSFRDEMEEFLSSLDLRYEQNVVDIGKRGQEVKFDFLVYGETKMSLLLSLSAGSSSAAHTIATDAFARLYDATSGGRGKKNDVQYLTVIDEANNVFKETDIDRLDRFSSLFWFPAQQEELTKALVE